MSGRTIKARGKVFRDPVHRLIRIQPDDSFILELIDTPVFQRLRRIRQLGVSWMTYHGAEHSRFSHSMGVFNFAQRILAALKERYAKNEDLIDYLEQREKELKAAALLHDIGHTPFSHLLERAFVDHSSDHEQKSKELICDENAQIATILTEAGLKPEVVAEITQGPKGTSNDRLIVDIVSSQLDADRMDYLLRDSLHTGVEYGTYDAEWLIRNLCIGREPHSQRDGSDGSGYAHYRLCLDRDRGMHTAEQLILARLHMTMQVYLHRVTRGFEVLLLNLLRLAAQLADRNELPPNTPEVVTSYFAKKGRLSIDEWCEFDEMAMFAAISVWSKHGANSNPDLQSMASAFLRRERVYLSRRCNLNIPQWESLKNALKQEATQGIHWELDAGEVLCYKGVIYEFRRPKKDEEEQSAESILLTSGDLSDIAVPVDAESRILRTLDLEAEKMGRIYYDREKAQSIEKILDQHKVTS